MSTPAMQCESCGKYPDEPNEEKYIADIETRTINAVIDWLMDQADGDERAWDTLENIAQELANESWKKVGKP